MCVENYAQYDHENASIPGALGLGEAMASNISSAFYAFTFLTSVAFAVLSDAWLGRYITLCLSFWYVCSYFLPSIYMFISINLPVVLTSVAV
jgi:POT family proton-dependent oligopeptide transporter